ncbi:substrate-binding domain-containing protein [Mucilaginibacter gynuensis]|uniref:histidine kinase n=2 Tax=Mucilaginibacter gynuensis TaxID=1302236 RepID=A0ABP8GLS3_9SPHI
MLDEMKMELSLHPDVKFVYTDARGNSSRQVAQVRQILQKGVDLLIISPNEAQPLNIVVKETLAKGIPVVVIDRKTSSNDFTAYVGADNYQIGKMAGNYFISKNKGQINALEITGSPASSPAIERAKGFADALTAAKRIRKLYKLNGNWTQNSADRALSRHKDMLKSVDAIFAHNDVMAASARRTLEVMNLNRPIFILGVDGLPGAGGGLEMIANKMIQASVLYPTGGKEAVQTAFRILNRERFEKVSILRSLVIDSTNVQLMQMQWERINSQQKDIERQQYLLEEQRAIYKSQATVLNIVIIMLVLVVVTGGLAFYFLMENRKINRSLEAKNDHILQQRNELIEMSARAEMATEAKLNFFTNISHEFRTPLTLMLGPIEDLIHTAKLNNDQLGFLKLAHKNIFILMKLVNQLLDYRKIEYDNQTIHASPNNIIDLINEVIGNFRHIAHKRNIDLRLFSQEKECTVWFDINMLDKVFFNLISNAFKFVGDGGHIFIHLHVYNNTVQIDVEDNGIGMTSDQATHIFEHFYQADNGLSKGSGLGLALTREIIQLHHGSITVKSIKWQSTVFTIKLPLGEKHLKEDEKFEQVIDPKGISEQASQYFAELETTTSTGTPTDNFKEPREHSILIIEDNNDLLHLLSSKLGEHYEIYTAMNGRSGVNEAFENVPDLIISDVVLPELSGRELTERLKSDIRTSHIPIILLTAQISLEHQIAGMKAMADAYMTKPFNFPFLLETITNLLRNRHILKEHYTSEIKTNDRLPVSKTLDKKFINDFAGYIEQNLSNEHLNVEDISKAIGVSRIQLYRKVKALLGYNITDYIMNRRLKKAQYLLTNEDHTISMITYMVGFSTPNYFSTVFKAKYGCTPTEYKKQQRT